MLLVSKHEGSWRFCVDYKKLNQATLKTNFPFQSSMNCWIKSMEQSFFIKLDLRLGYHQVRMHSKDIPKTIL